MDVLRLVGVGLIICFACVALRGRNPEFALLVSLCGGFVMIMLALSGAGGVIEYFDALLERFNVPSDGFLVLVKCLGLSYVARIACDTCTDCGESSTGAKIEFAAKIGILIAALPVFEQLMDVIMLFSG